MSQSTESLLNIEAAVKDRYSAASEEREQALCCPVNYEEKYLKVLPQELIDRDYGCGDPSQYVNEGETVLDLGSGGGKICYIASQIVGPSGKVIGVDMNPAMCRKAKAHATDRGTVMECHEGAMEAIPVPDASVDAVISNGVINLSFRKRKVIEELFRVVKPGGRISITDIVSAKQLTQSIVNDPKLWAS